MSMGGGAAGLTLNVADTVFLMEPSLNPAIEAQAAARVHRLGALSIESRARIILPQLWSWAFTAATDCNDSIPWV